MYLTDGDGDYRRGYICVDAEGIWKSICSTQFCSEHKTALKYKVLIKNNNNIGLEIDFITHKTTVCATPF